MKTKFFVVFDQSGPVRMTKKHTPSLYRNEIAVSFSVDLPNSVFRAPVISASVVVPEDKIILPETIDVEILPEVSE